MSPTRRFLIGLARAVGGAVVFTLPLYMTMEMWELGSTMDRWRLVLLTMVTMPLLVGLSHVSGFEATFDAMDDIVDAGVAWGVGVVTGVLGLALLGAFQQGHSWNEIIGKVTLQAIPGSIGALLAQSQFSDSGNVGEGGDRGDQRQDKRASDASDEPDEPDRPNSYWSELFIMGTGALFLAFNVAPTEEIILIAYTIAPKNVLALVVLSLLAMHAFVYNLDTRGGKEATSSTLSVAIRYTVVGYAIAVAISGYMLWTFGRLDGTGMAEVVTTVLVLAVPASIGAAAARLLL